MIDSDTFDPADTALVTLGSPLGGRIRTWDDQRPQTWTIVDPGFFDGLPGTGAILTDPIAQGRYRDAAVLDRENNLLCVETTTPVSRLGGVIAGHEHIALVPVPDPVRPSGDQAASLWVEFERILVTALEHAFERGELLIVSGPSADGPSVMLGAMTRHLRRALILTATPAPSAPMWPDARQGEEDRTSIVSDSCTDALREAAVRTTVALDSWDVEPLDAVITYVVPIEALAVELPWTAEDAA